MSYANGTTFYNLPQTVGTDKRDWFDTNQAFADIDSALHSAVEGQATDAEAIETINSKLVDDEADITSLQSTTATHSSQITTLANGVQENAVNIADVRNDSEDMICAFIEATATSSRAYAIGDYFIYNDVLYRAITSIAIGDTIVPDTNCTTTNVSFEINKLYDKIHGEVILTITNGNIQSNDSCNVGSLVSVSASLLITSAPANALTPIGTISPAPKNVIMSPFIRANSGLVDGFIEIDGNGTISIYPHTNISNNGVHISCTYGI